MQTKPADPPYVPLRRSGWPTRRAPRWAVGAGALLLAAAIAVGLSHRPTIGQRATDFRSLLQQLNTDIQSCSGGIRESLLVLHRVDAGTSSDIKTAVNVANTASANCSPANNELLDDLTAVQVPESLASYQLQAAVTALIDWSAPHAEQVAADVATVLSDRGTSAEAADRAALSQALRRLDAQRAVVYAALEPAIRSLSPASAPPTLYG
jgi:hypothetical protein